LHICQKIIVLTAKCDALAC